MDQRVWLWEFQLEGLKSICGRNGSCSCKAKWEIKRETRVEAEYEWPIDLVCAGSAQQRVDRSVFPLSLKDKKESCNKKKKEKIDTQTRMNKDKREIYISTHISTCV